MRKNIKHSLAFKLGIVKQALKRESSLSRISADNLVNVSLINRWVQFYERFGEAGLQPQYNTYSLETKLAIIEHYKGNNLSLSETCLQYGIRSVSVLTKWIRILGQEGVAGLAIERRGRNQRMASKDSSKKIVKPFTDHEKVLEENKLLRAENDFLKKLRALIQKEDAEKKRKR